MRYSIHTQLFTHYKIILFVIKKGLCLVNKGFWQSI